MLTCTRTTKNWADRGKGTRIVVFVTHGEGHLKIPIMTLTHSHLGTSDFSESCRRRPWDDHRRLGSGFRVSLLQSQGELDLLQQVRGFPDLLRVACSDLLCVSLCQLQVVPALEQVVPRNVHSRAGVLDNRFVWVGIEWQGPRHTAARIRTRVQAKLYDVLVVARCFLLSNR